MQGNLKKAKKERLFLLKKLLQQGEMDPASLITKSQVGTANSMGGSDGLAKKSKKKTSVDVSGNYSNLIFQEKYKHK